jgi:hydroxyproline O-arabinosyltransferase
MAGGDKMVAFTRILHRSRDDFLSDTIPTFRVDPLHPKCDDWCEYPVTDRGNAVRVFLDAAKKDSSLIKAPWIYMVESDYVFMKPLVVPNPAAPRGTAWGSPFGYIVPTAVPAMMRKMYPESAGPVSDIPGTGPAPILMHREDWETVTPDWERLAAVIENDKEMVDRLAWVREMYGFSVALALNKVKIDLTSPPDNIFISQLPPDKILGKAQSYHYTLCTWYKTMDTNEDVWSYDKRFYTSERNATNVPLIQLPPPYPGDGKWKFLEGMPVTKVEYDSVLEMIQQMNLAIEKLEPMA